MKKLLLGILLSFSIFNLSYAKEPINIDVTKKRLMVYESSGEYQNDQALVIEKALNFLRNRLSLEKQKPTHKKLAIVLDIDETSLSNYPDMVKLGFGGTMEQIDELEGMGHDAVIAATLKLYRYAKEKNVAVFFITGRPETTRTATEQNLKAVGYVNFDGLYFKPDIYRHKPAALFKAAARREIEQKGYKIILNIGDQLSDLSGGYSEKTYKLPNPYYLVP